jgi:hypothetical protein
MNHKIKCKQYKKMVMLKNLLVRQKKYLALI